jgi:hypothetical protein
MKLKSAILVLLPLLVMVLAVLAHNLPLLALYYFVPLSFLSTFICFAWSVRIFRSHRWTALVCIFFSALYLFILIQLLQPAMGRNNRHPISEQDRRRYYGDAFIYQGAPFCCIYVGLNTNETAVFASTFWRFADQHDIRKPKKHYRAYSGPPLATCKSDRVSVFVGSTPTTNIVSQQERFGDLLSREQPSWQAGIWMHAYCPTNASRIMKDGHEVLAPFTGTVRMASNDTNYPVQDFKRLSGALIAALQSAFPDRAVSVFSYDGDAK